MKITIILFAIIILLFFFLRLYHLKESLNFGTDQGLFLLDMQRIIREKKLTLIGPTASFAAAGRYIQLSSLMYYLVFPFLLATGWNVLSVSYFFIFLQCATLTVLFLVLLKKYNTFVALCYTLLFSVLPVIIDYSRFFWNPNFLIPFSNILLALLICLPKKKMGKYIFLIGFIWGIGFQTHLTFALAIGISIFYLFFMEKIPVRWLCMSAAGFLIGFSPLLIFELRHDFYNTRTLFFIFTVTKEQHTAFGFMPHYILSLIPFALFVFSWMMNRLRKKQVSFTAFIMSGIILYSFIILIPVPSHGFTMVDGWNYNGVLKTEKIIRSQILHENIQKYNIVDILTGDTRALAIRSLLTIHGSPPMAVDAYPASEYLFIYSKVPYGEISMGDLWETNALKPMKLLKTWPIQNSIYLYLVTKERSI